MEARQRGCRAATHLGGVQVRHADLDAVVGCAHAALLLAGPRHDGLPAAATGDIDVPLQPLQRIPQHVCALRAQVAHVALQEGHLLAEAVIWRRLHRV